MCRNTSKKECSNKWLPAGPRAAEDGLVGRHLDYALDLFVHAQLVGLAVLFEQLCSQRPFRRRRGAACVRLVDVRAARGVHESGEMWTIAHHALAEIVAHDHARIDAGQLASHTVHTPLGVRFAVCARRELAVPVLVLLDVVDAVAAFALGIRLHCVSLAETNTTIISQISLR